MTTATASILSCADIKECLRNLTAGLKAEFKALVAKTEEAALPVLDMSKEELADAAVAAESVDCLGHKFPRA